MKQTLNVLVLVALCIRCHRHSTQTGGSPVMLSIDCLSDGKELPARERQPMVIAEEDLPL